MRAKFYFLCLFLGLNMSMLTSQTWQSFDPGYPDPNLGCSSISLVNKNVVWAAHSHYTVTDSLFGFFVDSLARVTKTTDGGTTWNQYFVPIGNPAFIANLMAIDENTAWICGIDGGSGGSKVLKTSDGGQNWDLQTGAAYDPSSSWVNFVHFWNKDFGITMGDGGVQWTRVSGDHIPNPISGEFGYNGDYEVVGNTIWFGTNKGRIFRSYDFGENWEVFESGLPDGSFDMGDNLHGFFAYNDFDNFKTKMNFTRDGGENWTELNTLPENGNFWLNDIEFIPESDAIIMTTVNNSLITGLFRTWVSYNDGAQWTILDHSSDNMGWLKFLDPETGWSGRLQALSGPSSLFKYVGQPLIKMNH
ncbi:MAG: hypothetical protein IPG18_16745 [Saprospiraceae bacterium]|nr:hypothetical protein [Saprospiraceae bacterium]